MSRGQTDIFHFPKERVSSGDKFRCRKCRMYLFSFDNLTSFHKKIEPVDQCSAWYLGCDDDGLDLPWIRDAIDKVIYQIVFHFYPCCFVVIPIFIDMMIKVN